MRKPTFPAILPESVQLQALASSVSPPGDGDDVPEILFDPVPRKRNRRSGWTEERQRAFIAALAHCGCVRLACRKVGLSARNVYRLLDLDGSESFAAAWDKAEDIGRARLETDALERAINGAFVPVYRKGRLVRVEYRRCDRLAIAMLGGRDRNIDEHNRVLRRAQHKADLRDYDAGKAEIERERAESWKFYNDELKAMIERGRAARQPRVRTL